MPSQDPTEQQVENLRIRFYRAYLGDVHNRQPPLAPISDWLQKTDALKFDNVEPSRSRYHDTGNGRRVYTEVDRQHQPIQFRLNRTKYQGVPPAEQRGKVDTEYLSPGKGLMETWHAMAFDENVPGGQATFVAIATKGNSSPNTILRDYIKDKFPQEASQLKIEQLAHKDILGKIQTMGDGTLFEISVKPSFVEQLRAVDSSLADALQASQNAYKQSELTMVVKPDKITRGGLRNRFLGVIGFALDNEQRRANITKLRLGGMFGNSSRATILNLLSNDLSVEVEVPYPDGPIAILDADTVYNRIQDAYTGMASAIHEGTEMSEWPARSGGTSGTSSSPIHQQLSLFHQR